MIAVIEAPGCLTAGAVADVLKIVCITVESLPFNLIASFCDTSWQVF